MKQYLQTTFLGLSILLILSRFAANADTTKVTTSQVKYGHYYYTEDTHRQKYHGFLPSPAPEGLYYYTRMSATANVDNTPKKENIVLIVVYPKQSAAPFGNWSQAFLLITDNKAGQPQKKAFFRLFDIGRHPLEVPAAKPIELHSPPFICRKLSSGGPWGFHRVSFELVDLTGDGILEVWAKHAYGVAVISFQEGEFKKVCSAYSSHKREDPIEYVDLDNDGIYEIKIPDRISNVRNRDSTSA